MTDREAPMGDVERLYTQLRTLASWALEGRHKSDPQSWFDAPATFAHLFDELDRRLAGGERLPDVWSLLRSDP